MCYIILSSYYLTKQSANIPSQRFEQNNTLAPCALYDASLWWSKSHCKPCQNVYIHGTHSCKMVCLIASVQIDEPMEHGGSTRHDPLRILPVSLVHPSAPVFAVQLIEISIRCTAWSLLLLPRPSTAFVSLRRHRTGRGSCVAHIQ